MKSTPLNKLKKKPKKYFRNLGIVKKGRRKKSTIRFIVEKSYEALPREYRKASKDEKTLLIENLVNRIWYDVGGEYNVYEALREVTKRTYHQGWGGTLDEIYKRFRTELPSQYAKYYSYVYRLGYSPAKWFFDNGSPSRNGSVITVTVELPIKTQGQVYQYLEVVADMSTSSPISIYANMYGSGWGPEYDRQREMKKYGILGQ